jgi:1-acyl-sn-glycerol-3-phosphate acyltransferase
VIGSVLATLARLVSGARVRWAGCRPERRQRVYFANHSSHFDFLVLWAALPAELRRVTRPVAARDYWQQGPLRRFFARRVFHAVLIDRRRGEGQADPLATMDGALGTTDSLILFPEGTRGEGETIAPFRAGLYTLALRRPDVELVPVYIGNLNRVLPKGEFLPVPLSSSVTFGAPMRVEDGEPRDAFLARAREAVLRLRDDA